jgi:CubicO group peptidase (beta-lactamase class C family)
VGDAVRRFADDSLRFEPGSAVLYSNEGYVLLACAIEGASGESYDAYLGRAILGPAGMRSTFAEDVYRVMPHLARSYLVRTAENTRMWEGLWTPAHLAATTLDVPAPADPLDPSLFPGAGNYRSTPSDVVRFVLALERGILLSDTMRAKLFTEADAGGKPSGRTLGDWLVDRQSGRLVARVLGSVWSGSFAVVTVPGRRVTVALASNVEFNQPAELMRRILELLDPP